MTYENTKTLEIGDSVLVSSLAHYIGFMAVEEAGGVVKEKFGFKKGCHNCSHWKPCKDYLT